MSEQTAHPPWYRLAVWTGLVAVGLGLVLFFYRVRVILTPFLLALFLAYLLEPPVQSLTRRGLGRVASILVVYAVVGLVAGAGAMLIVPKVATELGRLGQNIPVYAADFEAAILGLEDRYQNLALPSGLRAALDEVVRRLQAAAMGQVQSASGALFSVFHGIFSLIAAPLIAFYILKDLHVFRRALVAWLPARSRGEILALLSAVNLVISGFVRGQLLVALAVGLMATAATALLGLRYATLIGLLAGITDVIPYFGPVIGALPALMLALPMGFLKVAEVIVAFLAVHQLENAVVGPKIMADNVDLHPLTVMFAILAGGVVAGVLGMVLAVPVVGVLKVLAVYGYRRLVTWRESWPDSPVTRVAVLGSETGEREEAGTGNSS